MTRSGTVPEDVEPRNPLQMRTRHPSQDLRSHASPVDTTISTTYMSNTKNRANNGPDEDIQSVRSQLREFPAKPERGSKPTCPFNQRSVLMPDSKTSQDKTRTSASTRRSLPTPKTTPDRTATPPTRSASRGTEAGHGTLLCCSCYTVRHVDRPINLYH